MDNERLARLAEKYGTPLFVFDEDALESRMRAAKALVGPSVRLCYSIKANPFLIPAMLRLTEVLEVCSPGELSICEALHVPPERVLLSGVNKTASDVAHAMDVGVRHFTAESPLHVRLIDAAARARGLVVPVLLRLTAGTQFGMDETDLRALLARRAAFPGVRFEGLHYFAGTQRKKIKEQLDELSMLSTLMDDLRAAYGLPLEELEYGPGLYFPYFANEDDGDTLAPLRELAPALQAAASCCRLTVEMGRFFASECGAYLTAVADTKVNRGHAYAILDGGIHHVNYLGSNMGMRVPRIARLPGAAAGGAEALATGAQAGSPETPFGDGGKRSPQQAAQSAEAPATCAQACTPETPFGDGGGHGPQQTAQSSELSATGANARVPETPFGGGGGHGPHSSQEWTLCGSLCTTADVLVRRVAFDGLEPGDVLAFLNIGAYSVTEGPALFLSRDLPGVVLADADGDRLARGPLPSHTLNRPQMD